MIIEKFTAPTSLDIAPFGAIWKIVDQDDTYIQVSQLANVSRWITFGSFLETCFRDYSQRPSFIDECFKIYLSSEEANINKITAIIKDNV